MHRPWRHISVLLSIVILGLARLPAAPAPAETDAVATKIRLLSAALHARDTGDTAAARQRLEELLQLSPNDETVKRLLASLERLPEKRISVAVGTVDNTPAAAAVAEADQLGETLGQHNDLAVLALHLQTVSGDVLPDVARALLATRIEDARTSILSRAFPASDRLLAGDPEAMADTWIRWLKLWQRAA